MLVEVDTGFVIWYRAEKYKTSVELMLDRAVDNYQHLLRVLSKQSHVICISAPLPTIQDGQNWGEIADARKCVKATQLQRTKLTIRFNKRMQKFCEMNGYSYLSLDDESLGQNGIVSKYLLNSKSSDHHYDRDKYADMIIKKLKARIEQDAPPDGNLSSPVEGNCRNRGG